VASFSRNIAANKFPTIHGTGEQTRDYVYVGDVARANVLALESDPPSGVYNIGTGTETSVNQLYELLRDIACTDLLPRYGPAKPGEQLRTCIDPSRAARVLGWYPQVRLVAGLRKTLEFFGALRPTNSDKDYIERGTHELYPRH
jgi:UDP-glucose 4-epimerase